MHRACCQKEFDAAIRTTVSAITAGRVMSYGEVARRAGYPRHARMVSKAMSRCDEALPWHRVVRADRRLAFAVNSACYNKQQTLLEKEGVIIISGKVVAVDDNDNDNEQEDLDALIWAPPGLAW